MSNHLKYTLSKDDKFSSSKPQNKHFKSVNMYNMTANKSQSKWNLDEVLDQSCSTAQALTDLDKSILRILESKYIAEKLLTDDLFEFMLELMNNQYRNMAPALSLPGAAKKKSMETLDKMKKEEELLVLREIDRILVKLLTTQLGQLKNFATLFKQKLARTIKILDKNRKKEGLIEFQKLCESNAFQKPKPKQTEQVPAIYSKKLYLEHKQNKLKKMKDKSKKSLGTMGSHQNNSDSRHNKSSNKGSIEEGGSLFRLLQDAKKHHARENYDYSAIMSGSMNIRKRINTEDSNSREISSMEPKTEKSNKNQGFVFFRPQKGQLPPKRH